ncbi:MAG: hypothetical protein ACFB0B_17525 [Thermonemataceae bacterium]|mgnify:CR=1 FL=1
MKTVLHILFVALCLLPTLTSAQNLAEGRKHLESYFAKIKTYELPSTKQTYYLSLEVTTIPNTQSSYAKSPYSSKNIPVEIVLSANRLFYESKYINFYNDQKEAFTIIHPQRLIVWTKKKAPKEAVQNTPQQIELLSALQQRVLTDCKVIRYEPHQGSVKKIVLRANDQLQKELGFRQITYYLDVANNLLKKQHIHYIENYKIKQQTIIFKEFNLNYKGKVAASAYRNVFGKDYRILPQYQSYRIEYQ